MKHIAVEFNKDALTTCINPISGEVEPWTIKKDAYVEFDVLHDGGEFLVCLADSGIYVVQNSDIEVTSCIDD